MSLPKIDYPIHNIEVPSTKKTHKFRPFLVKEEKLLLMAKESDDVADYLSAMKQVINNCAVDKKFDVNKIATFDLEYIFLKLRSVSIDNMIKIAYVDNEDQKTYEFDIDLNTIKVVFPDKTNNNIKLSETSGLLMKYPSSTLYDDRSFINGTEEYMFELIIKCLDKLYDGDQIYEISEYKKEEIVEFLENLNIKTYENIKEFLVSTPKLYHCINYKNALGHDRKIEFNSLNDFFS